MYNTNKELIPIVIDPHGRWSPMFQYFLFGTTPTNLLKFYKKCPASQHMYDRAIQYPSPSGILHKEAKKYWRQSKNRHLYGLSYTYPSHIGYALQKIGLTTTKQLAIHTRNFKVGPKFTMPPHPAQNLQHPPTATIPPSTPQKWNIPTPPPGHVEEDRVSPPLGSP